MKLGFVDSHIGKMLVYGACGTGKSTFIDLLMENPVKEVRISTLLATRPMSMFQFDLTNEQHWVNLSPEQRKEFLAKITMHIEAELEEKSGSEEEDTSGRADRKHISRVTSPVDPCHFHHRYSWIKQRATVHYILHAEHVA